MSQISLDSVVASTPSQVSAETSGETAILHTESGVYYGLDRTGTGVWRHIRQPITIRDLCRRLGEQYEARPGTLEADVLRLLSELEQAGLVDVTTTQP